MVCIWYSFEALDGEEYEVQLRCEVDGDDPSVGYRGGLRGWDFEFIPKGIPFSENTIVEILNRSEHDAEIDERACIAAAEEAYAYDD